MGRALHRLVVNIYAIVLFPAYAGLVLLFNHTLAVYAFCFPLFSVLLYRHGRQLLPVPPLLAIGCLMLCIGLCRPNLLKKFINANQAEMTLYLIVLVIEALVLINHKGAASFSHLLGRTSFALIILAVAANVRDIRSMRNALYAFALSMGILGVLTVLHGFHIFSLPIAMYYLPARTFLGVKFPVPRTIGINMSYGEFGIMAAFATAILMYSYLSPYKIFASRLLKWAVSLALGAGILVSQGRGVFLGVGAAGFLSFVIGSEVVKGFYTSHWQQRSRAWMLALAFSVVLVLGIAVFMPTAAESDLINVNTIRSQDNAASRVRINQAGIATLLENPFLGIGHGAYTADDAGAGIHNHFLEQFVATGLLGGLPYLSFYLLMVWNAWQTLTRSDQAELRGFGCIFLIAMIATIMEYQVFPGFLVETVGLLCGLILSAKILVAEPQVAL
ncbi:MAG: O-antigen ligase family protein [Caldilineaceae bacterium]